MVAVNSKSAVLWMVQYKVVTITLMLHGPVNFFNVLQKKSLLSVNWLIKSAANYHLFILNLLIHCGVLTNLSALFFLLSPFRHAGR